MMGKLRNTRCLQCAQGATGGRISITPAQGWLYIILWAQILCVHIHIHICHVLTSSASEKAKGDLEILILTVILQRKKKGKTGGMGPWSRS